MSKDMESPSINVEQLFAMLAAYISGNRHSRCVNERWLASELIAMRDIADALRYGRILPTYEAAVSEFRLMEIEGEKQSNQRAIEALDREAAKLRAPAAIKPTDGY